jgi:hypothetical protein
VNGLNSSHFLWGSYKDLSDKIEIWSINGRGGPNLSWFWEQDADACIASSILDYHLEE